MCGCKESSGAGAPGASVVSGAVPPVVDPTVPLASPISPSETGDAEGSEAPPILPPGIKFCFKVLREGCYTITYRPTNSLVMFEGTLRVDRSAPDGGPDNIIVSGDLYRRRILLPPFPPVPPVPPLPPLPADASVAAAASSPEADQLPLALPDIPIFARSRYASYLKIVQVTAPVVVPAGRPCPVTLSLIHI